MLDSAPPPPPPPPPTSHTRRVGEGGREREGRGGGGEGVGEGGGGAEEDATRPSLEGAGQRPSLEGASHVGLAKWGYGWASAHLCDLELLLHIGHIDDRDQVLWGKGEGVSVRSCRQEERVLEISCLHWVGSKIRGVKRTDLIGEGNCRRLWWSLKRRMSLECRRQEATLNWD